MSGTAAPTSSRVVEAVRAAQRDLEAILGSERSADSVNEPRLYDAALSAAELAAGFAAVTADPAEPLRRDLAAHSAASAVRDHHGRFALHRAAGREAPDLSELEPILGAEAETDLGSRCVRASEFFDDPGLEGEHRLLRQTYRDFAESHVRPVAEAIHRQDLAVPGDLIRGLADLGCFGLSIPERYGGVHRDDRPDCLAMLLATEELSRGSLGAAGSLITRPEVLARALLEGGTEAQKLRWLPALASGEQLCAVAVTEPDAGSDVAAMRLRARRVEGGYRLDGAKMWSTFAARAHVLMVLARTGRPEDGHRGLSLFLVDKPSSDGHDFEHRPKTGGSLRGRAISTLGYRGMHSYELFFDDVFVPEDQLVGRDGGVGRGFYMTMAGFAGGRIQTAARAVGVMQAAYGEALAYARQRRVFGRPIGELDVIRVKLGRMASRLHAARAFTYATAARMDAGSGDVDAAMAKLLASRGAESVAREALQIHGGMGYAEESPVSRFWVDARVLSIFEGTEEVLALKVIGRSLLAGARGAR